MAKNISFCRHKTTFCTNFIRYSILDLNSKNDTFEAPKKWIQSEKKWMRVQKATVHGNCCWEIRGNRSWKKQNLPLGTRRRAVSVQKVHKARTLGTTC